MPANPLPVMRHRLRTMLAQIPRPQRHCLAVEAAAGEVRAALVRGVGGRLEILDYLAMKGEGGEEELPAIALLREMAGRLNCPARTPAVFVTPLARSATLSMNRERIGKMRRHLLVEAVKWEAEAYTGIQAHQAMAGVEISRVEDEPGRIRVAEEEVPVQVTVLESNVYRAIKERMRLAGLKLVRVYPPEVCFHLPLLLQHPESDRGVLEIGAGGSGFALLRGGDTLAINTMNITVEMIHRHLDGHAVADLEETLRYNLGQAPPPHPVALTGSGALDHAVVSFLRGLSPLGVEPLLLKRRAALTSAGAEESPAMSTAVGAAMRELHGGVFTGIGVTDAVPLPLRIRQNIFLAPVAAAGLVLVLLLAHNLLMRHQEQSFRQRQQEIAGQLQEREEEIARVRRARSQIEQVDRRFDTVRRQLELLRQDRDRQELLALQAFLQELRRVLPAEVGLLRLEQDRRQPLQIQLHGRTHSPVAALEFAASLRQSATVAAVELIQPGGGQVAEPAAAARPRPAAARSAPSASLATPALAPAREAGHRFQLRLTIKEIKELNDGRP